MTPLLIAFSVDSDDEGPADTDESTTAEASDRRQRDDANGSTDDESVAPAGTDNESVGAATAESADANDLSVRADENRVVVRVGETRHELTPAAAARLREAVGEALRDGEEYLRTGYKRRPDGRYAVTRRGDGDPAKVFDSEAALRELFRSLPAEFGADDVGRAGITGSRRHLLVRHFAERPAFDCRLVCRNPLTARKTTDAARSD